VGVFVRSFLEIDHPYAEVRGALLHDVGSWLPGLADSAGASGEARMADVGFGRAMRLDRTVTVELGTPIQDEGRTLVPIRWRPESREALFPALEGEIEAAPVGADRTQLSMTARYTPPFGLLGRVADRALLHRVAEATVKDFVDNVAAVVRDRLAHAHPEGAETSSPGGATGGP
jgi:hypothetical protein